MMMIWLALGTAAMFAAAPAFAAPDDLAPTPARPAQASPFQSATPVSGHELGTITGRADLTLAVRAQNTSTVANNSVSGQSQTGAIGFDSQAFQNLNGLSLLSANTGNNVSINASLNVNIAIQR